MQICQAFNQTLGDNVPWRSKFKCRTLSRRTLRNEVRNVRLLNVARYTIPSMRRVGMHRRRVVVAMAEGSQEKDIPSQMLKACTSISCLSLSFFCVSFSAIASDALEAVYNPQMGSDTFKNIAGVGYILLVIFYFFRLFKKRAERAVEVKLSSSSDSEDNNSEDQTLDLGQLEEQTESQEVTVLQCLMCAAKTCMSIHPVRYFCAHPCSQGSSIFFVLQWCSPSGHYMLSFLCFINPC